MEYVKLGFGLNPHTKINKISWGSFLPDTQVYAALKTAFINLLKILSILSKQFLQENLVQEERIPELGLMEKTNLHEWWAYGTKPRLLIF